MEGRVENLYAGSLPSPVSHWLDFAPKGVNSSTLLGYILLILWYLRRCSIPCPGEWRSILIQCRSQKHQADGWSPGCRAVAKAKQPLFLRQVTDGPRKAEPQRPERNWWATEVAEAEQEVADPGGSGTERFWLCTEMGYHITINKHCKSYIFKF